MHDGYRVTKVRLVRDRLLTILLLDMVINTRAFHALLQIITMVTMMVGWEWILQRYRKSMGLSDEC